MKKMFLQLLFLLLFSTVSHAKNAATPYQFGYDTENMTKEEKAALIQSQTIIRLNPMRARIRNVDNGGAATMVCDESSCTVTPIPWPEPLVIFDSSSYMNMQPVPSHWTRTAQEKRDNAYSLALDGPGVIFKIVEGVAKYSSKCKRNKLTQEVECSSPYLIAGARRLYPPGASFREIWRQELAYRTLIEGMERTGGVEETTVPSIIRDQFFDNLQNSIEHINIRYGAPDGKDSDGFMASTDAHKSTLWISPRMIDSGQGDWMYVGIDGKKYQFSALRILVHEFIHIALHKVRNFTHRQAEIFTVIITNQVLHGIEMERGFYYNKFMKRYMSINEMSETFPTNYIKVPHRVRPPQVKDYGLVTPADYKVHLFNPIVK